MTGAAEFYKQAQELIKEKKFDDALEMLERSLAIEETAEALHDKAVIHFLKGDARRALELLRAAVKTKPDYAQAYANLAKITLSGGDRIGALEYAGLAMRADAENPAYRDNFIQLIHGLDFKLFNPKLKDLVTECLEDEKADHDKLSQAWFSLSLYDPDLRGVQNLMQGGDDFPEAKDELNGRWFLLGLRRLIVSDMGFEKFLTRLRRFLLEERPKELLPAAAALAEYCFRTEYIFSVDEEEARKAETLRRAVEADLERNALAVALCGCYGPLHLLKNAAALAGETQDLDELLTQQVREPLEELELRKTIPALTAIEDKTSQDVRAQYEEFPYPRWKALGHSYAKPAFVEGEIRTVLIAGCGTGREALEYAKAFPEAQILAIDMSLASLSYAARKTKEAGIENVVFGQADILKLDRIGREFDLIVSSGVLHHMKDPQAGWEALAGMLRPGGYMEAALYSEAARRGVVAAREAIRAKGYGNSREEMRRFRDDCTELLDEETLRGLTRFRDFFSASECRDLLFHVMEHRFTLPQIKGILERSRLGFIAFTLPDGVKNLYLQDYPDDQGLCRFDNMIEFEQAHPDAFRAMYVFWLRKL